MAKALVGGNAMRVAEVRQEVFLAQIIFIVAKSCGHLLSAVDTLLAQRVNGSLAVSRALGDFEYKNVDGRSPTEQLVSPEPEFYIKVQEEGMVERTDGRTDGWMDTRKWRLSRLMVTC